MQQTFRDALPAYADVITGLVAAGLLVAAWRIVPGENDRGLGLTVVREILGRHGFEFSLARDGDGPTCFRIGFGRSRA